MIEILTLISTLVSCYLLVRAFKLRGITEKAIVFFLTVSAQIAVWGYLLSALNRLGDIRYWAVCGLVTCIASAAVAEALRGFRLRISHDDHPKTMWQRITGMGAWISWYKNDTSAHEKILLSPMIFVTVTLGILNLSVVLFTAPHNFDSMTYHLSRMAYYLQHNNLDYYPANYWAQVVHPKNSILLLIYSYLVSGRNENVTQLAQFISYWVLIFSAYGIARRIGSNRIYAIFAAMVGALLVEVLLESTTTQNDLIIAAYFGAATCLLFSFRETLKKKYLALAALGIGLSVGTSAKALLSLPSISLVACYVLFTMDRSQKRLHNLAYLAVSFLLSVVIFALPAGYFDNYNDFGNPIGPERIMRISFEGKSFEFIARNGTKNILRMGFDSLRLEGLGLLLPLKIYDEAQSLVSGGPKWIIDRLGINLEKPEGPFKPFSFAKPLGLIPNEDWSFWGILGFALIWVVVFLSAIGVIKSRDTKVLSYAAILYVLAVAFAGYYEPHVGRYFASCAVFAVPTIGIVGHAHNKLIRAYILVIVLIGSVSAVSSVLFQPNRALVSTNYQGIHRTSVFQKDRIAQLTANNPRYYWPIRKFDSMVPRDATVAVVLKRDNYDYPLFGEHLTRKIVPINSFYEKGFERVPESANYMLFQPTLVSSSSAIYLGANWYLLRLR